MTEYERVAFERCATCGLFGWVQDHTCPPRWTVWLEDYHSDDEGGDTVYAVSGAEAAERFVETYDAGDYRLASNGFTVEVRVTAADGEVSWFIVTGETVTTYRGRQLEHGPSQLISSALEARS